jgi:hypothetical protein
MVRGQRPLVVFRTVGSLLMALMVTAWPCEAQPARDRPDRPLTGTGTIAGRILVAGERNPPVRRARVALESDAAGQSRVTDSDTDGRYRFANLPPGTYRLRADKPGFVTWGYGSRHGFDPGQPIQLGAGAALTADVAMPRGAALDGRVVNDLGDAIANVLVSACRITYGPYGRQVAVIKEARSDDLGRYRIHSLPAGDYLVRASGDVATAVDRGVPGARTTGIGQTYYPGTGNLSEAERVTTASGRDAAGLDFRLLSVTLARVTLTVLDSSGKPPSVLGIRMQRVGAPPGEVRGSYVPSQPNQVFFDRVPQGEFWLMAATPGVSGGAPEFAVTRTVVDGREMRLTLTTHPGLGVVGRVVPAEGSTAAPAFGGIHVQVEPVGFDLPNPAGSRAPAQAAPGIAQDGTFTLTSVFGPSLFRLAGLPAGWALVSVRLGEQEIIDTPIDLAAAEAPSERPLTMVVTRATGDISGSAIDAQKQPVPNARIVVFPEDPQLWTPSSRFVRNVLADHNGAFAMASLLPGKYFVAGVPWMDSGAWLDPETLGRLRVQAQPVVISAGEKLSVTVTAGEVR